MGTIKPFCTIGWNAIRAGKNNTMSQWLQNTPKDEITCRLANHDSMK